MTTPTISIAWGHQHDLPADWTPPKWANGPRCHVCYQAVLGYLQEELKQNGWWGSVGRECARRVVQWFIDNPPNPGDLLLINIEAAPLTLLSHRTERDGVVANRLAASSSVRRMGDWFARLFEDRVSYGYHAECQRIMVRMADAIRYLFPGHGVGFMGMLDQDTGPHDGINDRIAWANMVTAELLNDAFKRLVVQCYFRDLRALDIHEQPEGAAPASMIQLRVREACVYCADVWAYVSPAVSGSIGSGYHATDDAATALAQVWAEQRRNGGREQVVVWLDASEREAELQHAEAMVRRALEIRKTQLGAIK